jgi:hypothetical protein
LDQIYYYTFVSKNWGCAKLQFPKWKNHLEMLGVTLPHLWKCVWILKHLLNMFLLFCFTLGCKPNVIRVMTRMKSILYSLKNILNNIYLKYLSKWTFIVCTNYVFLNNLINWSFYKQHLVAIRWLKFHHITKHVYKMFQYVVFLK